MTDLPPERCENCRFWKHGPGGEGECHRLPPTNHHAGFDQPRDTSTWGARWPMDGPTGWPHTHSDDWCGEYELAFERSSFGEPLKDFVMNRGRGALPIRVLNGLWRWRDRFDGEPTVHDLIYAVETGAILSIKHFGLTSYRELVEFLMSLGFEVNIQDERMARCLSP